MKRSLFFLFMILIFPALLFASDDPNIPADTKAKIQIAMEAHIHSLMAKNNGSYPIFDPDGRNIVQLNFLKLHKGVVVKGKQGRYYISCADFTDNKNTEYDLDFLVSDHFEVVETLVHKKAGNKLHYDVH